ncbi:hypothetical protein SAMN04515679_1663 [Pelosinus fermentans]|jgi:hypothetical protein|uniref:Transposase InsH N-terminal domain-containing protein n=1 Tax=Pelosinus fermentans B4 TaxID=1149862 RepID=I9B5N7_9FIRM|nr:hypothetical protein FB4_2055 [Pelosinus fermentans B4]EIW25848.1 hypothetical protein FA11_2471 [Pelosinus fermentans A11]OAM93572.1 hypothetical protein FR7_01589 [Pelosinus fermentans DSM 17108]SDQ82476.1 hypothetical protein SAMN04515679_1663 [Pelosinus fermentans]
MIQQQQSMVLSPYIELYNLIISKDNILRQINELVDFSFVYEELKEHYCLDNGRNAIDPIRMRACMYARPVTWQSVKRGKGKKALGETKLIRTISILSFANDAR